MSDYEKFERAKDERCSQERTDEQQQDYYEDEMTKTQKKVFAKWINTYVPNCIENDIIEELRDGMKLVQLLFALTGDKIKTDNPRKVRRHHLLSNVNNVLLYLEKRGLNLVNIHSFDIVDGNPVIILGLVWLIILHFHIEEYLRIASSGNQSHRNASLPPSSPKAHKPYRRSETINLRETLMQNLNKKFDIKVKDFSKSWRDGRLLLTMIDKLNPTLNCLQNGELLSSNHDRLEMALHLAETTLNIAKLLDAGDIDVDKPDERSMMVYLSQYLQKEIVVNETIAHHQTANLAASPKPMDKVDPTLINLDARAEILKRWVENILSNGIGPGSIVNIADEYSQLVPDYREIKENLPNDLRNKFEFIGKNIDVGKQLVDWITKGMKIVETYEIPASNEEVLELLNTHYENFSSLIKFDPEKFALISEISNEYDEMQQYVNEWEKALIEASKRWSKYNLSKEKLIEWIKKGEQLLTEDENIADENTYEKIDTYFIKNKSTGEAVLSQFLTDCDTVFETLPEKNRFYLNDQLKSLQKRFIELNDHAPIYLIKLRFNIIEKQLRKIYEQAVNNNRDDYDENLIESQLNELDILGQRYYQLTRKLDLTERANEIRELFNRRRAKLTYNQEIKSMHTQTVTMMSNLEMEINSLTVKSNFEIIKYNHEHIEHIRQQAEQLRRMSIEHNIDIGNELKQIEQRLIQLDDLLENKCNEKIANWIDNEIPLKLINIENFTELHEDIYKYKKFITNKDLLNKLNAIEDQIRLREFKSRRFDSIEECTRFLNSLKVSQPTSPSVIEFINSIEKKSLPEWKQIDKHKNELKQYLFGAAPTMFKPTPILTAKEIKEKLDEVNNLEREFLMKRPIISEIASEFAINSLNDEIIELKLSLNNLNEKLLKLEHERVVENLLKQLNEINHWIIDNPVDQINSDEHDTLETALRKINSIKDEWSAQKDQLNQIKPKIEPNDYELNEYAMKLQKKLNEYDWPKFIENERLKFKLLRDRKEQEEAIKRDLNDVQANIDDIEKRLSEINVLTDTLHNKEKQLKVCDQLIDRVQELKVPRKIIESNEYNQVLQALFQLEDKLNSVSDEKRRAFNEHLKFNECYEKFTAWIQALEDKKASKLKNLSIANIGIDEDLDNDLKFNKRIFEEIKEQKSIGDFKLSELENLSLVAKERTSINGKRIIDEKMLLIRENYSKLFNEIEIILARIKKLFTEENSIISKYNELNKWLKNLEDEIKLLPLKKNLLKKQEQLNELENLKEILLKKETEINEIKMNLYKIGKLTYNDIQIQYEKVLDSLEFQIKRWKNYVHNHQRFDDLLIECKKFLKSSSIKLNEIENINDEQIDLKINSLDSLLEEILSERAFTDLDERLLLIKKETTTEGYDVILIDVRKLLNDKEKLLNTINNLREKLLNEVKLVKEKFSHLEKLLNEIELNMNLIKYPGDNLIEKEFSLNKCNALSNHLNSINKLIKFDTGSGNDELAEKLNEKYLQLIKSLAELSELCVHSYEQHKLYQEKFDSFDKWLYDTQLQIPKLYDGDFEKIDVLKEAINKHNQIKLNIINNEATLISLSKLADEASGTTSEAGKKIISNEMKLITDKYNQLLESIKKNLATLNKQLSKIDESDNLQSILNDIERWIKANPNDEFIIDLSNIPPDTSADSTKIIGKQRKPISPTSKEAKEIIESVLNKLERKRIEWEENNHKLDEINILLQTGNYDEGFIEKYIYLRKLLFGYDWNLIVCRISEIVKHLIDFSDLNLTLKNIVKQINALIDILYYSYELNSIEVKADSIGTKRTQLEIAEYIKKIFDTIIIENLHKDETLYDQIDKNDQRQITISEKLNQFKIKLTELINEKQLTIQVHIDFHHQCEELIKWMQELREAIPKFPEKITDIDDYVVELRKLLTKQDEYKEKLNLIKKLGFQMCQRCSLTGQRFINTMMRNLEKDGKLFADINENIIKSEKLKLETIKLKTNLYEKILNWINSLENEINLIPKQETLNDKINLEKRLLQLRNEIEIKRPEILNSIERDSSEESISKKIETKLEKLFQLINETMDKWQISIDNHQELEKYLQKLSEENANLAMNLLSKDDIKDEKLLKQELDEKLVKLVLETTFDGIEKLREQCDQIVNTREKLFTKESKKMNIENIDKYNNNNQLNIKDKKKLRSQSEMRLDEIKEEPDLDNLSKASSIISLTKKDKTKKAKQKSVSDLNELNDRLSEKSPNPGSRFKRAFKLFKN